MLAPFNLSEPWPQPLTAATLASWREQLEPLVPLLREAQALHYFSAAEVREAGRCVLSALPTIHACCSPCK